MVNSWYKLVKIGVTRGNIYNLMQNFEKYEEMFESEGEKKLAELGVNSELLNKIRESYSVSIEKECEDAEKNGIKIVTFSEEGYPEFLRNIASPPVVLYIKGKGEFNSKSVGVVGTRKISSYGRSVTEKIVEELVSCGVTIVSGLAAGVDSAAHERCLKNSGYTIGVAGTGVDVVYPYENRRLWQRVAEEGTVISEYPMGFQPSRWSFPERNRIIAGLSKGVVVAESYKDGGALITAKIALEEGRDVFTVPGNIFYPSYEGNNMLIRKSEAIPILSGYDIVDEFKWGRVNVEKKKKELELTGKEELIYTKLDSDKGVDELILDTGLSVKEILILITKLEIKGVVKAVSGGRYRRTEY